MWRSPSGSILRVLLGGSLGSAGRHPSPRPLTFLSFSPFPAYARALGNAGVLLLSGDSLCTLPDQFVAGHCLRDYSTRSSYYSTDDRTIHHQQDQKVLDYNRSNCEELVDAKIGNKISSKEKQKFLVNTLMDLKDSKEAVYGTLDAWVAWEQNFPLVALKRALLVLEKEEQWHRVVQVIKWVLSKGQGTTMGTYEQLIRALEKDNRAEEAHRIWVKKISHDLHSVPWRFCDLMLSIYYRNNMLERLLKLFQELEAFGRKPTSKSIVRKVGDAYEVLGLLDEKNKLLEKYNSLFCERLDKASRKLRNSKKVAGKNDKRTVEKIGDSKSDVAIHRMFGVFFSKSLKHGHGNKNISVSCSLNNPQIML
ncbi:hypothetical protein Cni_G24977 [Canna indica]|uniref:Pentatricopeptide repeat-containing protein n=1 Tax=Canna indica TaxID=4628 RepID=A0AAQ3KX13_9LILI|nr:hypothetical protein Cni_G24977 [Canna indica]